MTIAVRLRQWYPRMKTQARWKVVVLIHGTPKNFVEFYKGHCLSVDVIFQHVQ